MKRREFITLLGGAAAAWPLAASAQQAKLPTIGFLGASTPLNWNRWTAAFVQRLHELGWIEDRTVAIEYRWAEGSGSRTAEIAAEFVRLKVDVILTSGGAVPAAKQATSIIPIVFAIAVDPVGSGLVASLARPGGNVTGLTLIEFSVVGKMLEVLKQIAPGVSRVAFAFNPDNLSNPPLLPVIEAAASTLAMELTKIPVRNVAEIEPTFATVARQGGNGLMCLPDPFITAHRDLIVALAARYRLPAIYFLRSFVIAGGLVSYGVDVTDLFRRAASYVDRILKGARPADLPVQQPTKFQLAINLKAANSLGLEVPPTLLARADEVIE